MKHAAPRWFAAALAAALLAACSAPGGQADWSTWDDGYAAYAALAGDGAVATSGATPGRYILSAAGTLRGVAAAAAQRGDTVVHHAPHAGFAVVETSDPAAYARLANVIVRDYVVAWRDPVEVVAFESEAGDPPASGDDDPFFDLQWGHVPVRATAAWNAGVRGAGVRVAVLDGGFDMDHPDLAPNVNAALSANFVAGETIDYAFPDPFSHGSHVAGTVAAADNGFGVIGVAPEAELVLIKVLGDAGSGSFADVGAGMLHAADVGADIANMSLGAQIPQSGICDAEGCITAREVAALRVFMQRIANYATWKGTLLISSAGNSGLDLDTTADLVVFPAGLARVVSVSATAPVGWATDPANTDFDGLASYSNYGRSGIDVSAPGGDFMYPGNENCTIAGLLRPCWVFDLVFSTGNAGWYWSAGTSMASPHAAGVAALILSEHGGSGAMTPAQLERALIQRAADLGDPGRDKVHGQGAVRSGY
jgi:lantibiotic leader peptide-processing serine protease